MSLVVRSKTKCSIAYDLAIGLVGIFPGKIHFSTVEGNGLLKHAAIWINHKGIVLSQKVNPKRLHTV